MRLPPQWAYESIGDGGWDDEVIEDLVEENERGAVKTTKDYEAVNGPIYPKRRNAA